MAKRGPKFKKLDEVELEKLALMQCTTAEIASWFKVSPDTIERNYAAIIKRGREIGAMSMKRRLFQKVQDGDLGAIVWFGKNFCNMSDKVEQKIQQRVTEFKIGFSDEEE